MPDPASLRAAREKAFELAMDVYNRPYDRPHSPTPNEWAERLQAACQAYHAALSGEPPKCPTCGEQMSVVQHWVCDYFHCGQESEADDFDPNLVMTPEEALIRGREFLATLPPVVEDEASGSGEPPAPTPEPTDDLIAWCEEQIVLQRDQSRAFAAVVYNTGQAVDQDEAAMRSDYANKFWRIAQALRRVPPAAPTAATPDPREDTPE